MKNNSILTDLNWRYAVKKFDPSKKISEDTIEGILQACNLTATSLGLQPFKMVLIDDQKIIASLKEITFDQENVQTCSDLLVLCAETNVDDDYIENFVDFVAEARGVDRATLIGYENMCKTFINGLSEENKEHWLKHQCYIVLGNLLTACATFKVDSCPMEGFNPIALDKILNLDQYNLRSVLIVPLGYRAEEDKCSKIPKLRKSLNDMVIKIVQD